MLDFSCKKTNSVIGRTWVQQRHLLANFPRCSHILSWRKDLWSYICWFYISVYFKFQKEENEPTLFKLKPRIFDIFRFSFETRFVYILGKIRDGRETQILRPLLFLNLYKIMLCFNFWGTKLHFHLLNFIFGNVMVYFKEIVLQ